ncbi:hypothetical protein [Janthinobacterium sp.]|uniref:hypothetical protein n=1 Tax=Janthinobacterium sp. TaxID=1871054 RepID=UPI0025C5369F|nr:hypothetical protein [Janthinobacterium sp.]NBV19948.1 hypothetical protein [Janthinobacterium sp.]
MAKDTTITITLKGEAIEATPPPLFAIREEIVLAWHDAKAAGALQRVRSTAILLSCPKLLKESGYDYARAKFDPLNFGGAAYSWLREKHGATLAEVATAGDALIVAMSEDLFPREAEVQERKGFSPAAAVG